MAYYSVRIYSWESPKLYESELELARGEMVIVAGENSNELGIVEGINPEAKKEETTGSISRIATQRDREVFNSYDQQKPEIIDKCKEIVKKAGLEMKIIDGRISLDGKQVVFSFTADGRVDFRELVKELAKEFKKMIRMQQIGTRDEARNLGGYGVCGRDLCCVKFSGSIQSITTDMARIQQIAHRGTERISGLCGRLMCCLAYEAEQYKEMLAGMPEVYSVIVTPSGKGTVIEINAVTQKVTVKLENGEYISFDKKDLK
jgi:cell fate regulator YaaT (PSP1 superfamily)